MCGWYVLGFVTRYALHFEYLFDKGNSSVRNTVVHSSFNTGIHVQNSDGVNISAVVVHHTLGQSIYVKDSNGVHITGSLAVNALRRSKSTTHPTEFWEEIANYHVCPWSRCDDIQVRAAASSTCGQIVHGC